MNVEIEIDNGSGFCFGVTTAIKKAEEELAHSFFAIYTFIYIRTFVTLFAFGPNLKIILSLHCF